MFHKNFMYKPQQCVNIKYNQTTERSDVGSMMVTFYLKIDKSKAGPRNLNIFFHKFMVIYIHEKDLQTNNHSNIFPMILGIP